MNFTRRTSRIIFLIPFLAIFIALQSTAQVTKAPIMGWSSWNNFRVNIDEQMLRQQADAMITSGLYDAGYRFINIDDGYFGGRDMNGKLFVDTRKFPSGMKALVDYIHSKKLKAGIYTDAGKNTCGSIWDKDEKGVGSGIYGHIDQDCNLFFKDWGFNFLKVDWCGGEVLKLDEQTEYTKIISATKAIDSNIVFNVCRWKFPGEWAINKADSWRISGDISAKFSSILAIIDIDAGLDKYASSGHYNDMDMLQVGRGMSYDEDKTHFSMWCMLNSPLLAGNDLRTMSKQTIDILTNKEIIALNQDPGFKQAKRIFRENNVDVWVKPLGVNSDNSCAIAVMNRSDHETVFDLSAEKINISSKSKLRDLWMHKNLGQIGRSKKITIHKHGVVVLRVSQNVYPYYMLRIENP
ncbi:glycoside hydrolase family 27 protein [Mucilaginibacter gossypiicola]|nr:glycoside hydrolase family 27 protein [Mucilaginibacter gossypiicola]